MLGYRKLSDEVVDPIYSIDKIRLRTRQEKEYFEDYMRKFDVDPVAEYWEEYKIQSYRHNWRFKVDDEEVIYLAFQHNSEPPTQLKANVVIEYNPNKISDDNEYLIELLKLFSHTIPEIRKVDVAVDFHKVNIEWLNISKGNKRKEVVCKNGGDDKTFYIGEENKDCRVKVYNKAKERSKKGKRDQVPFGEWTRYEITLKPNILTDKIKTYEINQEIPNITHVSLGGTSELNSTDLFILKAIKQGAGTLNDLPYRRRKKLKPFVEKDRRKLVKKELLEKTLEDYIVNLSNNHFLLNGKEYKAAHYA